MLYYCLIEKLRCSIFDKINPLINNIIYLSNNVNKSYYRFGNYITIVRKDLVRIRSDSEIFLNVKLIL